MNTTDVRDYYRTITEHDISVAACELLGARVMEDKGTLVECDCPHHQSISRRSLHINMDRQAWYCFGCGVGGDILQLVEFVQSGQVTAGRSGVMSDTHRTTRDWLAARVSLPPLSHYGLTPAEIARHGVGRPDTRPHGRVHPHGRRSNRTPLHQAPRVSLLEPRASGVRHRKKDVQHTRHAV